MKTEEQVWTVLVETNPVPDVNQYGRDEVGGAAYLATLEPRSSEMTQVETAKESETPKRPLGPWLIAAAAAVVLGVTVVLVTSNSETAPVATIPTPTTVVDATPTTISEQTETPTTQPATPTTTLPLILDGRYAVPDEVPPGTYRLWGGAATRLDENMELIDNYLVANYGIVIVQPTDSFIIVEAWIILVEDFGGPNDPIAKGLFNGVYLVGYDIEPGRYEVHPRDGGTPYWARLDDEMKIIDSEAGIGTLEVLVEAGDFAFEFLGDLRRIP